MSLLLVFVVLYSYDFRIFVTFFLSRFLFFKMFVGKLYTDTVEDDIRAMKDAGIKTLKEKEQELLKAQNGAEGSSGGNDQGNGSGTGSTGSSSGAIGAEKVRYIMIGWPIGRCCC